MTRIIIQVTGGNISAVTSTENIEYVVVDYDNIGQGESPVTEIHEADLLFEHGNAHESFIDPDDQEIKDELKRLHF